MEKRICERQMEESTRKQHFVVFRKLQDFKIIQSFSDLTVKNIKLFDDYIRKKISNQSSIHSVHKRLKVYVKEAVQYEFLEKNPYDNFQIARGEASKRKYLTPDELEKIRKAVIPNTSIEGVRDCFVFCCFTGLAFSDLNKFDFEKNVVEVDGKFVIKDTRTKTDTPYNITLLSPAMEILKRYDYHLPKMTNQQYNMRLKIAAQYAGIEKELTSHMARHTFATWALSQGIRIEVVSKMLAHTDIKTTQIYAKILQEDVYKGFDELETKLKG
ncbi:MAG: site-specific integrase [Oscillibacter sp.]|nr:site-specific integrase [Oscillibacter sp.]